MPGLRQAELINGVVFCMPSPVGLPHSSLHVPQPDVHLRILPECGGQSSKGRNHGLGAPELVIDVTAST